MFSGHQCDADAGENRQTAPDLPPGETRSEPQPFDQCPKRRSQALNQQQGKTRAEPGQSLKERHVANSNSQDAAEQKCRKSFSAQANAKTVSPNRQKQRRASQSPKVCFRAAD